MQSLFYIAFALSCTVAAASGPVPTGTVIAGASKVDLEIPVGVPLSGYNHGTRRVPHWPLKEVTDYTSYMMPSKGQLEPSYARALYIQDPSGSAVCYLSCDIIGMDGAATAAAIVLARSHGFPLTDDEVVFGASHSHSTAGAVTSNKLWELAPATDLLVPKLLDSFVQHMAKALLQAYQSAVNATVGIGITQVFNVTDNRRQHESPYVNASSIDPSLTIIRVDDVHGQPIATLWNFATHGTCYGPENMLLSGDIMGIASSQMESSGAGVALFINGPAGDLQPQHAACQGAPSFVGSKTLSDAVYALRNATQTEIEIEIEAKSVIVNFGKTDMNLTLERVSNCTSGGFLDICGICKFLDCNLNLHLGPEWLQEQPRFTAIKMKIGGTSYGMVTIPGEAIQELGFQIRSDISAAGFDHSLLLGYSQAHMGYFTTPREYVPTPALPPLFFFNILRMYVVGGYESELSFWGIDTGEKIRAGCAQAIALVK